MDWAIYGALIAGFLAVVAAVVFLLIRVLQAWRDFKRLRRHVGKELARVAGLADTAADKASRAGDQPRLAASLDRLRGGLAQLAVLRAALDEVSDTVGRVTVLYPRK